MRIPSDVNKIMALNIFSLKVYGRLFISCQNNNRNSETPSLLDEIAPTMEIPIKKIRNAKKIRLN
jgi:hypothetical protein